MSHPSVSVFSVFDKWRMEMSHPSVALFSQFDHDKFYLWLGFIGVAQGWGIWKAGLLELPPVKLLCDLVERDIKKSSQKLNKFVFSNQICKKLAQAIGFVKLGYDPWSPVLECKCVCMQISVGP